MFKLKGKTLFLLAVIVIGFAGVGFFFYTSLKSLNQQVETGVFPQKRTQYLKEIALNVNRLNNLYLVDSVRFSAKKADTIIYLIEKNLDSIKMDYYQDNQLIEKNLDTIPKLLKIVQQEYLQLDKERQTGQSRFLNDMEGMLQVELAELNLSAKDSITIIKQITSEIYNPDINVVRSTDTVQEAENRKSFFQRLFGGGTQKKQEDTKVAVTANPSEVSNETKIRDTLVSTTVDTLLNVSNRDSAPETKIISIFENVQRKRINLVNNLKSRETEIFQKNIAINNYIESLINDIILEEINLFNNYVESFSSRSKKYLIINGIIIVIFMLIGITAAYVIIKDINKSIFYQKKIEESEKRALREADEKQRFLYTMSHELRTPLTSIIGYSEVLDQNDENVQAIKTASDYLYQMTNEILDMAKIKAGIIEIDNQAINITDVFQKIKANFKTAIKQKGLQPIFEFNDAPIYLFADPHRLQQICYNLLHNAVKFTDSGLIKIGFTHEQINDTINLNLFIEDSGCGMTQEEQVSIFKDYQQAGTHKNKIKGTGLGMGIVKTLVDRMGGNIKVKSEINKGTRFDINFKFKKAHASQIKEIPAKITLPENALIGKRIYVLDDDPLITKLYQKILSSFGAEVITENKALTAKAHLLEQPNYDMVIFDLKMPQMKGNELLNLLKEQKVKPKNSVISTANILISEKDILDLDLFDHQIFKPIKQQDLVNLLVKAFKLQSLEHKTPKDLNHSSMADAKFSYNIESLKAFVGEDQQQLFDMLQLMLNENEKELQLLDNELQKNNHDEVANIIHKLSSRFAQLEIKPPVSTKEAEMLLRQQGENSLEKAQQIAEFWTHCNLHLQEVFKTNQHN